MKFNKYRSFLLVSAVSGAVAIGLIMQFALTASMPGPDDEVYAMKTQSSGKIIVGGRFQEGLMRLNADGTLDESFTSSWSVGGFNGAVRAIWVLPDDSIVAAGDFTSFDQTLAGHILKLSAEGTIDNAFAAAIGTGFDDSVYSLSIDSRGRIAVGGSFDSMNGTPSPRLVILAPSGHVEWSAPPETKNSGTVMTLAFDGSGQLWYGSDSKPYLSKIAPQ